MLTNKELLFDTLFYQNPMPMWIIDETTLNFIEINQAAINFYGYSREEFLTMTLLDIRPKEDYGVLEYNLNKSSDQPMIFNNVYHRLKSGAIFQVEILSLPLSYEGRTVRFAQVNSMAKS